MFSEEELKVLPHDDSCVETKQEILSIHEVCLNEKFDKRDLVFHEESVLLNCNKNDLDVPRTMFEGLESEDGFSWVDDNLRVSSPGFSYHDGYHDHGTAESSSGSIQVDRRPVTFPDKFTAGSRRVTSTSGHSGSKENGLKLDKSDPRTRMHYVKFVKKQGRTVKLWECGICGREFQHQYTLMRHLPTHTDERNFHCESCGKSFRQLSTLSQHRAIHSARRPYSCQVCNKTFNRVSTLISHRKTHSKEKPYVCPLCPKGFHQKGNLRNHMFTHTNERPYRCDICFKGFNQQSNLVCHKQKAHSGSDSDTPRRKHRKNYSAYKISTDPTKPKITYGEVSSSIGPKTPTQTPKLEPVTHYQITDWTSKSYLNTISSDDHDGAEETPKTYHMGMVLGSNQTPFALLKPQSGAPVLVKVVDVNTAEGKQMLVPATAEDLNSGGQASTPTASTEENSSVQIRVPVVMPRIKANGTLQLSLEDPHADYFADVNTVAIESCTLKPASPTISTIISSSQDRRFGTPPPLQSCPSYERTGGIRPIPTWVLSQAPTQQLDFITLDLFDSVVDGNQMNNITLW